MKNIPVYARNEFSLKDIDSDYQVNIFTDFISQLLEQDDELSPKEKRLIKIVDDEGTKDLNEFQLNLLIKIINRYKKECVVCNIEIPLNEVFHLAEYCNVHDHYNDKEE